MNQGRWTRTTWSRRLRKVTWQKTHTAGKFGTTSLGNSCRSLPWRCLFTTLHCSGPSERGCGCLGGRFKGSPLGCTGGGSPRGLISRSRRFSIVFWVEKGQGLDFLLQTRSSNPLNSSSQFVSMGRWSRLLVLSNQSFPNECWPNQLINFQAAMSLSRVRVIML